MSLIKSIAGFILSPVIAREHKREQIADNLAHEFFAKHEALAQEVATSGNAKANQELKKEFLTWAHKNASGEEAHVNFENFKSEHVQELSGHSSDFARLMYREHEEESKQSTGDILGSLISTVLSDQESNRGLY